MSINKWSLLADGTGMGGNFAESLLPVTYTLIMGAGGSRDGGLQFAQNFNFLIFHRIHYL